MGCETTIVVKFLRCLGSCHYFIFVEYWICRSWWCVCKVKVLAGLLAIEMRTISDVWSWSLEGWFDWKCLGWLGQLHRFSIACLWERAGCTGREIWRICKTFHIVSIRFNHNPGGIVLKVDWLRAIGTFGILGPAGSFLRWWPVLLQAPPICWVQARPHQHVGTLSETSGRCLIILCSVQDRRELATNFCILLLIAIVFHVFSFSYMFVPLLLLRQPWATSPQRPHRCGSFL